MILNSNHSLISLLRHTRIASAPTYESSHPFLASKENVGQTGRVTSMEDPIPKQFYLEAQRCRTTKHAYNNLRHCLGILC